MVSRALLPLSLLITLFHSTFVLAVIVPVHIHHVPRSSTLRSRQNAGNNNTVQVLNSHNAQYIANVTLGGLPIPVLLDTGSSDLWVTGDVPGARDSGKGTTLSYAVGQAHGNISFASFAFDGYNVSDQAFLLVKDTSTFSTDIVAQGFHGLVGLGPNSGSVIRKTMDKKPTADTVLNRIFQQNRTSDNYVSLLLDRKGDPKDPFTGQITISETVPGFENVTSAPKLPIHKVYKITDENQHWQVLADKDNSIIGPDGQVIQTKSIVPRAPSGTLVAVIDSGFTFTQVPRKVSDAIYGRVKGAVYDIDAELWMVPCDQYIPLSLNFGGVNFPVHPLDVVSSDFNIKDNNGRPICIGTFQPITSAFSLLGEYDLILGMSFLRNSYTLLNFGNFVSGASNTQGDPYAQLLPLTNIAEAKAEFITVRCSGVDCTSDPSKALLPPEQMQHSPQSPGEKKKLYEAMILSRWPYIFVGCLLFVILVVGFCVWRCCRRRRAAKAKQREKDSFAEL